MQKSGVQNGWKLVPLNDVIIFGNKQTPPPVLLVIMSFFCHQSLTPSPPTHTDTPQLKTNSIRKAWNDKRSSGLA